jgi:alpha-galactosidase
MKRTGLLDAGYNYIVIDGILPRLFMVTIDCWLTNSRSKSGDLIAHPDRFPSGIPELAKTLHSMGFLFGIYESAGSATCQGLPGSLSTSPQISNKIMK